MQLPCLIYAILYKFLSNDQRHRCQSRAKEWLCVQQKRLDTARAHMRAFNHITNGVLRGGVCQKHLENKLHLPHENETGYYHQFSPVYIHTQGQAHGIPNAMMYNTAQEDGIALLVPSLVSIRLPFSVLVFFFHFLLLLSFHPRRNLIQ